MIKNAVIFTTTKILPVCFLLIGILVIDSPPVLACSCALSESVRDELTNANAVFSGVVVAIEKKSGWVFSTADPITVTFQVAQSWKGIEAESISVTTAWSDAACGYNFILGESYLVYARTVKERLTVSLCSRTVLLAEAGGDLMALGPSKTLLKPVTPTPTGTASARSPLSSTPTPTALAPTVTPADIHPAPSDLEVAQLLFANRPLNLGELETEFRSQLAAGHFADYTRQDVDVNGDAQPEVLLRGHISQWLIYFAMLGYADGEWQVWLYTSSPSKYCAEVRSAFVGEEIIVDFLTCSGGTGVFDLTWEQRWVQCSQQGCTLVWSAPIFWTERVVAATTSRAYMVAQVERPDAATVRLTTRRFGVNLYPFAAPDSPQTAQRVLGPDTVDSYHWNGLEYAWQGRETTQPGRKITREFDPATQETEQLVFNLLYRRFEKPDGQIDGEGLQAAVDQFWGLTPGAYQGDGKGLVAAAHTGSPQTLSEWLAGLTPTDEPFVCRLTVQQQGHNEFAVFGTVDVPCMADFSRLVWMDLTGDGRAELLLQTIPSPQEEEVSPETSAGLERLRVYMVDEKLAEVAVIDGHLNSPDGPAIRWYAGAGTLGEVWAGLPLVSLGENITWPDLAPRFQIYRWDEQQQVIVPAEVRQSVQPGTSVFTDAAPADIHRLLANFPEAAPLEMAQRLTALSGSSRALFDLQAVAVEESAAQGIPMVIGTWRESTVYRLGGFLTWKAPTGRWKLRSFRLLEEKVVAARMALTEGKLRVTVIWNPCVAGSMDRCHRVRLYEYVNGDWISIWGAVPGMDGWPYSHTEAHFGEAGIEQIVVESSSWQPRPEPWFPQDPKGLIFAEANVGPHRWFTDTWQREGDRYRLVQHETRPSAYNTLVEFVYALKTGGAADAWITDASVFDQAQQAQLDSLPEKTVLCFADSAQGETTGPIGIGDCKGQTLIHFAQVNGQYLIERIEVE